MFYDDLRYAFMELFDYPHLYGYPREAVVQLLLPAFLPFNLLKGGLNAAFTFLLYKPIVHALSKTGLVEANNSKPAQKHNGLIILTGLHDSSLIFCRAGIILIPLREGGLTIMAVNKMCA